MYLLYDTIWVLAALIMVPWYLVKRLVGVKSRLGIRERFGFYSRERLTALQSRPVLWLHAVSVGETRAALPLLRALRQAFPGHALVLSNVTETGHSISSNMSEVDLCLFFPFDISWVVRRVLRSLRPALVLIVETEIWPNLARFADLERVPLVLVNGRISDRSYPRYRIFRPILRPVLNRFTAFCMQSNEDARRMLDLGASERRLTVTGNLKFDMPADGLADTDPLALRSTFHLPVDALVWVVGSTHPGEEDWLLEAYETLCQQCPELVLVLVPRHPERCSGLQNLLVGRGLKVMLRSVLAGHEGTIKPGHVLLVDTVGELLPLYRAADVVFVGGSLVPVGGHNVLEAAMVGRPVLFGPHMANFREIARLLEEAGGGRSVSASGLVSAMSDLLHDAAQRRAMGLAGQALLQRHAGATERTLIVVRRALEG